MSKEENKMENKTLSLTDEEEEELEKFPIPSAPLDEKQLLLRQEMGKKFCQYLLDIDETLTPELRAIYEKFPMWCFYTSNEDSNQKGNTIMVRRSYGVALNGADESSLHMVSARFGWVNDVVGGVPTKDVAIFDKWTDQQKEHIHSLISHRTVPCSSQVATLTHDAFLDPLGFIYFIQSHHQ